MDMRRTVRAIVEPIANRTLPFFLWRSGRYAYESEWWNLPDRFRQWLEQVPWKDLYDRELKGMGFDDKQIAEIRRRHPHRCDVPAWVWDEGLNEAWGACDFEFEGDTVWLVGPGVRMRYPGKAHDGQMLEWINEVREQAARRAYDHMRG